jgi:hypothetical protein
MPREDNVSVEFYIEGVPDPVASREAGREQFTEVEMCKILIVGDRDNNLVIRANEGAFVRPGGGLLMSAIERYPDHYRAFKTNEAERVSGTALSSLPFLGKAQIAELNFNGVKTAEQLAWLGEAAVGKIMKGRELRTQAQVWISDADKSAIASRAQMERDAMQAQNAELMARIAKLEASQPERPRRGRPPKAEESAAA